MAAAERVVPLDEDAFTLPGAWRRQIIPRRGRPAGSRFTLSPATAPSVPESPGFVEMLDRPDSDPELVTAARQALADPDRATVLRAAALLTGLIQFDGKRLPGCCAELDYWAASRGAAFAARMMVELPDLLLLGSYAHGFRLLRRSRHPAQVPFTIGDDRREQLSRRLRAYLAEPLLRAQAGGQPELAAALPMLPRLPRPIWSGSPRSSTAQPTARRRTSRSFRPHHFLRCSSPHRGSRSSRPSST